MKWMGKGDKCKRCKSGCFIIGFYKRLQKYTTTTMMTMKMMCPPFLSHLYMMRYIYVTLSFVWTRVLYSRIFMFNKIMCTSCELNNIINEIQISSHHNHSMCFNMDSQRQKREIYFELNPFRTFRKSV